MNQPPYFQFPTLQSTQVWLRPILPSDIETIIDLSFYDGQPATTALKAQQMQHRIDEDYQSGNSIHWGITQNDGVILGTCGYYRGFANETGELGFVLKPEFQGQGLMTVALEMVIDFGFLQIGLKRIVAFTTLDNPKAIALLTRLGFTRSGDEVTENETLASNDIQFEIKKAVRAK